MADVQPASTSSEPAREESEEGEDSGRQPLSVRMQSTPESTGKLSTEPNSKTKKEVEEGKGGTGEKWPAEKEANPTGLEERDDKTGDEPPAENTAPIMAPAELSTLATRATKQQTKLTAASAALAHHNLVIAQSPPAPASELPWEEQLFDWFELTVQMASSPSAVTPLAKTLVVVNRIGEAGEQYLVLAIVAVFGIIFATAAAVWSSVRSCAGGSRSREYKSLQQIQGDATVLVSRPRFRPRKRSDPVRGGCEPNLERDHEQSEEVLSGGEAQTEPACESLIEAPNEEASNVQSQHSSHTSRENHGKREKRKKKHRHNNDTHEASRASSKRGSSCTKAHRPTRDKDESSDGESMASDVMPAVGVMRFGGRRKGRQASYEQENESVTFGTHKSVVGDSDASSNEMD